MRLKRHYNKPDGWVRQVNTRDPQTGELINPKLEEGDCLNPPPLDYIELKHTGVSAKQNFSDTLVMAALKEGWMSFEKGSLILHGKPEDLRYRVLRVPGKYPSEVSPVGYETIHCYECELDAEQHARHAARKGKV